MKIVLMLCIPLLLATDEEVSAGSGSSLIKPKYRTVSTFRSPIKTYQEDYTGQSKWGANRYYLSDKDCDKLMEEFWQLKLARDRSRSVSDG